MNRLAAMQLCPLFWQRAVTATSAARSRSAEGITTNGSEPPSSSTVFFSSRRRCWRSNCPAPSLPVSVAALTRGSASTPSTAAAPISRVVKAPSGNPARVNSESRYSAACGTLEACLSTPALPAIRAGAANRMTCHSG